MIGKEKATSKVEIRNKKEVTNKEGITNKEEFISKSEPTRMEKMLFQANKLWYNVEIQEYL